MGQQLPMLAVTHLNLTGDSIMATYVWKGNVLTIDFEDKAFEPVVVDVSELSSDVQDAALRFGVQVALRNSTAGKMDDLTEGYKALKAKLAVFTAGVWTEAKEAKAAAALTDEEKAVIVADVIVKAKQAKGDKRTPTEIMQAFGGLPEEQRKAAVASLQKLIDKRFKAALRDRKAAAKADAGSW